MAEEVYIHPSSIVDDGSKIGFNTRIWHFCHIMKDAIIGKNCILGQNVFVGEGVQIGNGVKIQNNVSVYSGVTIEDEVFLGPSCVLTNVINPRSSIDRKSEFRETLIKKGATLGANSTIICGVVIGQYAFVAAGAVVTKDVPPFALVKGNPSTFSHWISKAGNRLDFGPTDLCTDEDGAKYKLTNGVVNLISNE
jgi:UDP-2-acetamido-3-amino-2,3-dideoxy-glucuronate N-acetyltransferase